MWLRHIRGASSKLNWDLHGNQVAEVINIIYLTLLLYIYFLPSAFDYDYTVV